MKTEKFWRSEYDDVRRAIRLTLDQIRYRQYDGPAGLVALEAELAELRELRGEAWRKYRIAASCGACGVR